MRRANTPHRTAYLAISTLLSITLVVIGGACRMRNLEPVTVTREAFGAGISVVVFSRPEESKSAAAVAEEAMERAAQLLSAVSDSHDGSPLQPVRADVQGLIDRAVEISEITGGAFDPSIAPLTSLWGFHDEAPSVPTQKEIEGALGAMRRGTGAVDLRAIAYGAAADTVAATLSGEATVSATTDAAGGRLASSGTQGDDYGSTPASLPDDAGALRRNQDSGRGRRPTSPYWLVDVGGHIRVGNGKPDGSPFRVGIRSPLHGPGVHLAVVEIENAAISTVGPHQGYFVEEGIRYHHVLDPASGYPAATGLLSVTVVADDAAGADAIATACYVLGLGAGMSLVESDEDLEAVFVDEDRRIHATAGIRDSLTAIHPDYRAAD